MKQVVLKSITLRDWKSLNVTVDFNPNGITTIQGRNGIGKSSIYHAWLWLLTGYTMAGENKNADLYDHKTEVNKDTPEAVVTATIFFDEQECTIERHAKAKFVRKRGTDIYEKAPSDEYTLYVDNIEASVSMFEDTIKGIFGVSSMILPYLLSGQFFSLLASEDVKKARTLLEGMTHDIPIEEMKDMDYTPLKSKLERYSIEQLKEQNANALAPLKQREHDIPIKIEEKQTLIANYKENDFTLIAHEIEECKNNIKTIDDRMMGTRDDMEAQVKERNAAIKKRGDVMTLIDERRRAYEADYQDMVAGINKEIVEKRSVNAKAMYEANAKKSLLNSAISTNKIIEDRVAKMENELQSLRDELVAIKSRTFDEASTICKYCGQPLPETEVVALRARFEEQKGKDKEDNIRKGKAKKEELEKLQAEIKKARAEIETMQADYDAIPQCDNTDIERLEKQISDIRTEHKPFSETDEYKALIKEHDAIEIPETKTDTDAEECKKQKTELIDKLESLNRKYGLLTEVERMEKDIQDLESEREEVGRHIVAIEQFQAMIATYEEERARRVSEQINSRMEGCRIRMWRTQKDGQKVKDCIITNSEGVSYATTNFSDRIHLNIQLQRLFCEYYSILPPTFIDEAYAFDSYHTPKAWAGGQQMILLSPSDDNFMNVQFK